MTDDDAAFLPRSERVTPRLPSSRSGRRRRPRSSSPPTSSFTGLRRPSAPDLVVEHVRAPNSIPSPGRPSGTFERRRALSDVEIDASIRTLVVSDRKEAAARVARAAGDYSRALALYVECGLHHGIGACLRALGRYEEAVAHLTLVPSESPYYREACRELARAAMALGELDFRAERFIQPYADSGPRSDAEIPAFLDLAELLWDAGDRRRAERCVTQVLRLDPDHASAQIMRLTWASQREREGGL